MASPRIRFKPFATPPPRSKLRSFSASPSPARKRSTNSAPRPAASRPSSRCSPCCLSSPSTSSSGKGDPPAQKLRRAAGQVRDLDVQCQAHPREEAASHGALRREARRLRRELKRQRDEQAAHLLKVLHKQTANLRPVFEKLLHTLAPAESLALSETQLTGLAHNLYAHPISGPTPAAHNDTAQLHALRKRAKLARYLAESAPPSAAAAHRLAAHFEKLQEAGGKWHDWLLLTDIAAAELGQTPPASRHASPPTLKARCAPSSAASVRRYPEPDALQNVAAQIVVLHNRSHLLPHVLRIHHEITFSHPMRQFAARSPAVVAKPSPDHFPAKRMPRLSRSRPLPSPPTADS